MRILILILLNFTLFISFCFAQNKHSFIQNNDTIAINKKVCATFLQTKFYKYDNIILSSKYRIIDSAVIQNTTALKVLILSPINQEQIDFIFPCNLVIKRILLVYNKFATTKPVIYASDDLVPNTFDFQSDSYLYGESLKATKAGFRLLFTVGSKVKCDLTMFFVRKGNKFYLNEYRTEYYSSGLSHSKDRTFKLSSSKKFELNRVKTLNLVKFPIW